MKIVLAILLFVFAVATVAAAILIVPELHVITGL
jgi:hypothetical protein